MMYVLDTNTLIFFFKGIGNVPQRLLATPPIEIGIPTVVVYELKVGIIKSGASPKRKEQLERFLSVIEVLPFGYREAVVAADIRAELEQNGTMIGPYDVLIAATAMAGQHTLVTHNTKEFARIEGLLLEDWF